MPQTQKFEAGMKIQIIDGGGIVLDQGLIKSVDEEGHLGTVVKSESIIDKPGYITEFAQIDNEWCVLFEDNFSGERDYSRNGSRYELKKIE